MYPAEYVFSIADLALYQSDVMLSGEVADIALGFESSVFRRQIYDCLPNDVLFMQPAIIL